MKSPTVLEYVLLVVACILFAVAGLYLLTRFGNLFKRTIRNEALRKNVAAWLIIFCFVFAMTPMNGQFFYAIKNYGIWVAVAGEILVVTLHALLVFNNARLLAESKFIKQFSFLKQKLSVFAVIVTMTITVSFIVSHFFSEGHSSDIRYAIVNSAYMGSATGLVYVALSYLELDRKRVADEKELEMSKLRELKTKAELDALHSKVNPHFLYNALNSIADLSVTDGKKARKMTIALADLFRYSINYSQNNYATIRDEVAMTEVYLQIEKIRFEDQLNYSMDIDNGVTHYLVPRFILQSLAENAVKHGLKVTRQMTTILLEIKKHGDVIVINIVDNGPPFPDDLIPGYGIKSVYDKMDLLFPGQYEIHLNNQPRKQVSIYLHKLIKNEPGV